MTVYLPAWNNAATQQECTLSLSNLAHHVTVIRAPCFVQLENFRFAPTNGAVQIHFSVNLKKAETPFRLELVQDQHQEVLTCIFHLTLVPDKYVVEIRQGAFTLQNISDQAFEIVGTQGTVEITRKEPRIIAGKYQAGASIRLRNLPRVKL